MIQRTVPAAVSGLFLTCLLTACGEAAGDRPSATIVRDSAGITIVENRLADASVLPRWRLAEAPSVEIGMMEGPEAYQLDGVRSAHRLSDGRLVFINGGSRQIRLYDADGQHLRTLGGQGGGPEEFAFPWALWMESGSLIVQDLQNRRLSRWHPDEGFLDASPISIEGLEIPPRIQARLADGRFLASLSATSGSGDFEAGFSRDSVHYLILPLDLTRADTIGVFPGDERVLEVGEQFVMFTTPIFGRRGQVAAVGDGFVYGSADEWSLVLHGAHGAPQRIIRLDRPARPVTSDDVERALERRTEGAARSGGGDRMVELLRSTPAPERMPAYAAIRVDPADRIWVQEYPADPGDDQQWLVFDPDGQLLGALETPAGLTVHEIGEDYLLGVYRDDFDVEYLRQYDLEVEA